jgi:hypothetical protein
MPKSDAFPQILPQVGFSNLRGLTLYELYRRQEMNTAAMELLKQWLDDIQEPVIYNYWVESDQLRKRLNRAIYLKRLKLWLLSLVGPN